MGSAATPGESQVAMDQFQGSGSHNQTIRPFMPTGPEWRIQTQAQLSEEGLGRAQRFAIDGREMQSVGAETLE